MANIIISDINSLKTLPESYGIRDKLTNIRVKDRLISKEALESNMQGRQFIPLSNLNSVDISKFDFDEEDWVTAGVVHKHSNTKNQVGKAIHYIQITDLKDNYVTVFLHGDSKDYPIVPIGGLVYCINPSRISARENEKKVALSISSHLYLRYIGDAIDYGVCCAIQRNDQKCTNAVNKSVSRYCMYHIQKTQIATNTYRAELSSDIIRPSTYRNDLSEGSFQLGKDRVVCQQSARGKKPCPLPIMQGKVMNGICVGGSMGARLQAQLASERKQKEEVEKQRLASKKRREAEKDDSIPYLGRGMLPGKIIRLQANKDSQIEEIQRQLNRKGKTMQEMIASSKQYLAASKPKEVARVFDSTAASSSISLASADSSPFSVRIGSYALPMKETTGNAVFDSLVKATKENLESVKEDALKTTSIYADQALEDEVLLAKERRELYERKEAAKRQMKSIEVNCYWCAMCRKYVESAMARDFCESQGHYLQRKKETKRAFECMNCHGKRTFIGVEHPVERCACGNCIWKECPFYADQAAKKDSLVMTPRNTHLLYSHDIKAN